MSDFTYINSDGNPRGKYHEIHSLCAQYVKCRVVWVWPTMKNSKLPCSMLLYIVEAFLPQETETIVCFQKNQAQVKRVARCITSTRESVSVKHSLTNLPAAMITDSTLQKNALNHAETG